MRPTTFLHAECVFPDCVSVDINIEYKSEEIGDRIDDHAMRVYMALVNAIPDYIEK